VAHPFAHFAKGWVKASRGTRTLPVFHSRLELPSLYEDKRMLPVRFDDIGSADILRLVEDKTSERKIKYLQGGILPSRCKRKT
jgi:hypothetical protein